MWFTLAVGLLAAAPAWFRLDGRTPRIDHAPETWEVELACAVVTDGAGRR